MTDDTPLEVDRKAGMNTEASFAVLPCRKRAYPSEAAALQRIADFSNPNRRNKHNPTRAYQCAACLGWHITSKRGPVL